MAEIITTHSLLINDILYNFGDIIPVIKHMSENKECELRDAEILRIKEDSILLMESESIYCYEIPICDVLNN